MQDDIYEKFLKEFSDHSTCKLYLGHMLFAQERKGFPQTCPVTTSKTAANSVQGCVQPKYEKKN